MTNKKKDIQTTYDLHVQSMSPERKKKFDDEYRELVLSELRIALKKKDVVSVIKLAHEAGIKSIVY